MSEPKLIEVYSAADAQEAATVACLLENAGIRAQVVGDAIRTVAGELPLGRASAPRIWVLETDVARAREIIVDYEATRRAARQVDGDSDWKCSACGEDVPANFDVCWNCNALRGSNPTAAATPNKPSPPGAKSGRPPGEVRATTGLSANQQRWVEISVVLIVVVLPDLFHAIAPILWRVNDPLPFYSNYLDLFVRSVQTSTLALYLLARSKESWSEFGLCRPRWSVDILVGVVVCMVYAAVKTVLDRFLGEHLTASQWQSFTASYMPDSPLPSSATEGVVAFITLGANSFSEELVMRGYLIRRFEQVLLSTWKSVVLSTLLFASYHVYQGGYGTLEAFVTGLLFGGAFCLNRRLWPLVIAHTLINVVYTFPR